MDKANTSALNFPKISFQPPRLQHWLVAVFMVTSFLTASWLTPRTTWFEHLGKPDFEKIIPKQFGDWELENITSSQVVDPQQKYAIENIYTQTVVRIYLHKPSGRHIMFSLAYGDNQTYSKQLHRPEACYSTQGFKIDSLYQESIKIASKPINVNRMTATIGPRIEQVTYFIRVGDRVISGPALALNYARMQMGLKGYTSDGLLFRVSEVADDAAKSSALQDQFIYDLLHHLDAKQQADLIGTQL